MWQIMYFTPRLPPPLYSPAPCFWHPSCSVARLHSSELSHRTTWGVWRIIYEVYTLIHTLLSIFDSNNHLRDAKTLKTLLLYFILAATFLCDRSGNWSHEWRLCAELIPTLFDSSEASLCFSLFCSGFGWDIIMFLSIVQPLQTLASQPNILQTHKTLSSFLHRVPKCSEILRLSGCWIW